MFENMAGQFIERCVHGLSKPEDLDAWVEYWHTHETNHTLQEFLGLSPREYEAWLTTGDSVILEILRRRTGGRAYRREGMEYAVRPER